MSKYEEIPNENQIQVTITSDTHMIVTVSIAYQGMMDSVDGRFTSEHTFSAKYSHNALVKTKGRHLNTPVDIVVSMNARGHSFTRDNIYAPIEISITKGEKHPYVIINGLACTYSRIKQPCALV